MAVKFSTFTNLHGPPTPLQTTDLPVFPHPVLYSGDLNCPHVNWGYSSNSADGECLVAWASLSCLVPLHDPKDMATFHAGRWNTQAAGTFAPFI